LKDELVLRVNFEKCNVDLRNQQLVRMAARYVGETTSKVYQALLRAVEDQTIRCYDSLDPLARPPHVRKEKKEGKGRKEKDEEEEREFTETMKRVLEDDHQPLIKTDKIAQMLDPELDLNNGLFKQELAPVINGHTPEPVDPALRFLKIEQHLRLLAVDPRRFVLLVGRDYRVPYNTLTRTLIDNTIEDSISARHGMLSARVIRMLTAAGNLDEAQLCDNAMVSPKDIRLAITSLCHAGFLDYQEVPKDTTRQTARLLWSVRYNVRKARRQLISDSYQAMTRLLARLEVERTKVDMVIEKSERTDVIGNEEKYLSPHEQALLRRWNEVEEKVLTQIHRIDELVATMRDFSSMEGWVLMV
jgi:DNA-directed RNA polymerase III subunit RPC3